MAEKCSDTPRPDLPDGMSYKELVEDVVLQVECSDDKEFFSGEPAKISACVDKKWTPIHDQCEEGESSFYRNRKNLCLKRKF